MGLFWMRVFGIKNKDVLKIKLDEKTIFVQLNVDLKIEDEFILNQIHQIVSNTKKIKNSN